MSQRPSVTGSSILMTCAPNAASTRVAPAPASWPVKSQIRMCESAPIAGGTLPRPRPLRRAAGPKVRAMTDGPRTSPDQHARPRRQPGRHVLARRPRRGRHRRGARHRRPGRGDVRRSRRRRRDRRRARGRARGDGRAGGRALGRDRHDRPDRRVEEGRGRRARRRAPSPPTAGSTCGRTSPG